jgi:hypothetical protein
MWKRLGNLNVDNSDTSADVIRRQMREIRRDIRTEVSQVVSSANQLLDWKAYVHRNPWLVLGSAAALGYLMIPRRSRDLDAVAAARESIDSLADEVRSQSIPKQKTTASALSGVVMPILTGVLMRVGTAWGAQVTSQILDSFKSASSDGPGEPETDPMKMREASHP